jgi:hypothetical protein
VLHALGVRQCLQRRRQQQFVAARTDPQHARQRGARRVFAASASIASPQVVACAQLLASACIWGDEQSTFATSPRARRVFGNGLRPVGRDVLFQEHGDFARATATIAAQPRGVVQHQRQAQRQRQRDRHHADGEQGRPRLAQHAPEAGDDAVAVMLGPGGDPRATGLATVATWRWA